MFFGIYLHTIGSLLLAIELLCIELVWEACLLTMRALYLEVQLFLLPSGPTGTVTLSRRTLSHYIFQDARKSRYTPSNGHVVLTFSTLKAGVALQLAS